MRVDHAFSIPIIRTSIDEVLIENTLQLVNNYLLETDFCNPPAEPGELLTTFYKNKDFIGGLNDRALLNVINHNSREFFRLLGFDPKAFIEITSWLQLYPPGAHFNRHDHYGALISGVIYLQVPPESGKIIFYNPLEARRVSNVFFDRIKVEQNDYNFNYVEYTPVKAEMIMFESWLQHSVEINKSTENRIAISFNIWGDTDA